MPFTVQRAPCERCRAAPPPQHPTAPQRTARCAPAPRARPHPVSPLSPQPPRAARCSGGDGGHHFGDAFLVGLAVQPGSRVAGCTVQEAGLRGLPGLYLTSVKRGAGVVHAVGPDFIVSTGDVLFFAGELHEARPPRRRRRVATGQM